MSIYSGLESFLNKAVVKNKAQSVLMCYPQRLLLVSSLQVVIGPTSVVYYV